MWRSFGFEPLGSSERFSVWDPPALTVWSGHPGLVWVVTFNRCFLSKANLLYAKAVPCGCVPRLRAWWWIQTGISIISQQFQKIADALNVPKVTVRLCFSVQTRSRQWRLLFSLMVWFVWVCFDGHTVHWAVNKNKVFLSIYFYYLPYTVKINEWFNVMCNFAVIFYKTDVFWLVNIVRYFPKL